MKLIIRLVKTELEMLFCSPVAWILLAALALQIGSDFIDILKEIVKIKALGNNITFSVTAGVVLGNKGIYETIQNTLYLYIPLLTMNLMSREYSSGSIKLLYSCPINSLQIVLGKYGAMIVMSLLLVSILALPVVAMLVMIPNIDITLILSGLLSMLLLMLAYSAIGLFMSALTSYQVVAAISTFATLAFLNYVDQIGASSPFLRDITYWLSLKGRASEMVGGLICSDDVVYFIAITIFFISITVIKINNERRSYSLQQKILRYSSVFVLLVLVGILSSQPFMKTFYDATHSKQRTLSKESQEVMKQLTGPLTITTYEDIFDSEFDIASPQKQKVDFDRFKMYTRFKPEIKMKYVYYYSTPKDSVFYKKYPGMSIDEIAFAIARKKRFNPKKLVKAEDLKDKIDLAAEQYRFVRVIERENGQQARLRLYDDLFTHPSEAEISASLKKMIAEPVKVGILTGHNERSIVKKGDKDFSTFASKRRFRYSLINQGFDLEELNLAQLKEIPKDVNILLIPDMRKPFTDEEQAILHNYIENGGNMLFMGDIGAQNATNPFLQRLGVEFSKGQLIQPSDENGYELILSKATQQACDTIGGVFKVMRMRYPNRSIVTMPGAVAIKIIDSSVFKSIPLLRTDADKTWNELYDTDFTYYNKETINEHSEELASYNVAVALRRMVGGKQQRIAVIGDADCFSNAELTATREGYAVYNFNMISTLFRWLCYNQFPVSKARTPNADTNINIKPESVDYINFIYCYLIPILIMLGYLIMILRRRKY